jgi:hypothetical protein
VTERVGVIARVRTLAVSIAKTYVRQQDLASNLPETTLPAGAAKKNADEFIDTLSKINA